MANRSRLVLSLVLSVILLSCELKDDGSSKPPVRGGPPGGTNVVSRKGGDGVIGLDHRLSLFAIAPIQGSTAGGTTVTVVGFNFHQAGPVTEVLFGNLSAASFVVLSNNKLEAVSPRHPPGLVGIAVRNASGEEADLVDIYEFVSPPPACLTLNPTTGTDAGGTLVTVTTVNFFDDFLANVPDVFFDTAPATSITVLNATTVLVETPPDPNPVPPPNVHAVDVTVVTTGFVETCVFPLGFTYTSSTAGPCMTLTPDVGDIAGGNIVFIDIAPICEWIQGTSVTFDGVPALDVTVLNPSLIRVTTPPGTRIGPVDVEATSVDRMGDPCSCLLPGGFTYATPGACRITGINPNFGGTNGGITVTLTGSGFGSAPEISFGAIFVDPNTITVDPAGTIITCIVPPSPMGGFVDVSISIGPGGAGCTLVAGFEYVLPGATACSITSISPPDGSPMGGDTVIINGSGFDQNSGVLFGPRPAQVTFVNANELIVVTPPGSGVVDVVVAPEFSDPCIFSGGYFYN